MTTTLFTKNIFLFILFLLSIGLFTCKSTPKKVATLNVEQTGILDLKKDLIRAGNTLKFNIDSILFAYNSTSIVEDHGALDFIYNFSQKCDKNNLTYTIKVVGHTDVQGSEFRNQILSEKRAKKIVSLLEKRGILANNLTFEGKGETEPTSKGTLIANHRLNRRVVFEFKFIEAPPQIKVILP